MLNTVVSLTITEKIKDYTSLWKKESQRLTNSSGSVIINGDDKYILTNSHCVQNSLFIECTKPGDSKMYPMSICDIRPEFDLALLEPAENIEEFWKDLQSIRLSDVDIIRTDIQGQLVSVVGFPNGGVNPCVTQGIVSRYVHIHYNDSIPNLAIQVDAAINPGNSGGPVFDGKENAVGIAFAHQIDAQNICYVIPSVIILKYINHTFDQGICDLGIKCDPLENSYLKDQFLPKHFPNSYGVLVRSIDITGSCADILKKEDVIFAIDDYYIDQGGMIQIEKVRVPYWHIIRLKKVGDKVVLKYIRDKIISSTHLELKRRPIPRVPKLTADIRREYYIFSGLVFQSLSFWYMHEKNSNSRLHVKKNHLMKYLNLPHEVLDDEVVILSKIFTSKYNLGYRLEDFRLLSINGIVVNNLQDVYNICENPKDKYIKFEFDDDHIIILDWETGLNKSREIANPYTGSGHHNLFIDK
jgi:S1-C subfamily serine protease